MAIITNIKNVVSKLKQLKQGKPQTAVAVGYTQRYAIYVHENLEAHHPVGQAKYLEQPARELPLGEIIASNMKAGATLEKALLVAGLRLQRDSQKLVPVDTGALKGSAFTRLEK